MPKQNNTSATPAAHQCGNREFACGFLANAAAASVAGLLLLAAPSLVRAGRVSQAENSMYGQRAWTNNTTVAAETIPGCLVPTLQKSNPKEIGAMRTNPSSEGAAYRE
jgi:hypothetical protein